MKEKTVISFNFPTNGKIILNLEDKKGNVSSLVLDRKFFRKDTFLMYVRKDYKVSSYALETLKHHRFG